jgi:DNA polymerase-1
MTIVQTAELSSEANYSPDETLQIYNGLDCCVTLEVWEALRAEHGGEAPIYDFERALQAPYIEIMNRGFLVDQKERQQTCEALRDKLFKQKSILNSLAEGVWAKGLNANSPVQCKEFLYSAMALPEVWLSKKGERKLSVDREALEKLEDYFHAKPIVRLLLAIRDTGKQLSVLESEIDSDGRFRTSYNIAGTETGRPSSSTSSFGTGGNAQNIAPSLRYVFIADPGFKICSIDLEQVEARDVGFIEGVLFDDWKFLNSCEGGDLHTNNAKLIWPELPWDGAAAPRAIADRQFYRDFSYRDMAKRGSHLSNYSGTAYTMARSLKIPQPLAEEFQARYCRGAACAYPAHQRWWQWTATQLQSKGFITNLFGRKRNFFGRPDDPATLREAIAFLPQSTTADRMNLGLWRVWKKQPRCQLLAQTYDSITFQAPDDSQFDNEVSQALENILVELFAQNGRKFVVPGEAKVGWNWGNRTEKNAEGLVKWSKTKPDTRKRLSFLERIYQKPAGRRGFYQ